MDFIQHHSRQKGQTFLLQLAANSSATPLIVRGKLGLREAQEDLLQRRVRYDGVFEVEVGVELGYRGEQGAPTDGRVTDVEMQQALEPMRDEEYTV